MNYTKLEPTIQYGTIYFTIVSHNAGCNGPHLGVSEFGGERTSKGGLIIDLKLTCILFLSCNKKSLINISNYIESIQQRVLDTPISWSTVRIISNTIGNNGIRKTIENAFEMGNDELINLIKLNYLFHSFN